MDSTNSTEVELVVSKKKAMAFLLLMIPFVLTLFFALYFFIVGNDGVNNVKVTNISSNSATVTWTTDRSSKGEVIFSDSDNFPFYSFLFNGDREVSFDDRDIEFKDDGSVEYNSEIAKDRITHHVTLRNLEENTQYFFRIKDKFGFASGGVVSFSTFYAQEDVNVPDPIYGTVTFKDEIVSDGVLFFKVIPRAGDEVFTSSNWYSAILNEDGGWSGDISNLVNVFGNYILNIGEDNRDFVVYIKSDKGELEEQTIPLTSYKPLANLNIE